MTSGVVPHPTSGGGQPKGRWFLGLRAKRPSAQRARNAPVGPLSREGVTESGVDRAWIGRGNRARSALYQHMCWYGGIPTTLGSRGAENAIGRKSARVAELRPRKMAGATGLEPVTSGLTGRGSRGVSPFMFDGYVDRRECVCCPVCCRSDTSLHVAARSGGGGRSGGCRPAGARKGATVANVRVAEREHRA